MSRSHHRSNLDLRTVKITAGVNEYSAGSALVEFGKTRVLCSATVEKSVPQWLAGSQKGWVTAEYAMLPAATHQRTKRERDKVGGEPMRFKGSWAVH